MYNLLICLVVLGVASGEYLPYGGVMPYGVGLGRGPYSGPYFGHNSPIIGQVGHFNDLSNFAGDGRHYDNEHSNGLVHQSLGSSGAMANGGGHGFSGGQRYANQQQGLGGYHADNYARNFNNGAGGFKQGNGYYDATGRGNLGEFNNLGHNKGHKTSGFHKSYHNVESGRDTKYVDEDHNVGGENFGQEFGNNVANAYGSGFSGAGANGQHGSNHHFDQSQQQGLAGGSFNGANYGAHGANNFYNGQDLSLRDAHLANNLNNYGQGYYGMGNRYGSRHAYYPYAW